MRGIFKRGPVYWIAYYHRGREYRESSGSDKESAAKKLLKKRIGEVAQGRLRGANQDRPTFDDLAQALLVDYQINGRRSSARHVSRSVICGNFSASIAPWRSRRIESRRTRQTRQKAKAANGSVNRELAALKRMFSLAVEDGRLSHSPHIPTLEEDNARQGFVDDLAFVALRENLVEYLRDPIAFLYLSGWRLGEMKALEWRDVTS